MRIKMKCWNWTGACPCCYICFSCTRRKQKD